MKFIELHCVDRNYSYFLNFDKVISMRRVRSKEYESKTIEHWCEATEIKMTTPTSIAKFYCQETPEEILQKIAEAERHGREERRDSDDRGKSGKN